MEHPVPMLTVTNPRQTRAGGSSTARHLNNPAVLNALSEEMFSPASTRKGACKSRDLR
jgi:hypothetical protein